MQESTAIFIWISNKHLKFNVSKQNCLCHPIHPSPTSPSHLSKWHHYPVAQFPNLIITQDSSLSLIFHFQTISKHCQHYLP